MPLLLAGLLALPAGIRGQAPEIVTSEVAVSRGESSLSLELSGDRGLSIAFREGGVYIDGDRAGSYEPGGALSRSWRELLGEAVALDDGPLAAALTEWAPPAGLEGDAAGLADRIDRALESALSDLGAGAAAGEVEERPARGPGAEPAPGGVEGFSGDIEGLTTILRTLRSVGALGGLGDVLDDVDLDDVRVFTDSDYTVREGETLIASVLIIDGDLDVYGTVDGDVVVIDGEVTVHERGRIDGKVRLVDAELNRYGGVVAGSVRSVDPDDEMRVRIPDEREIEARIEEGIARGIARDHGFRMPRPLRYIIEGIGGVLQTAAIWAVLVGLGLLLVYFARERLEIVADTARNAPGRSAVVGFAGAFLALPAYVLGAIALAVSIIGIPVLVAWVPLFPVAVALAATAGYLAVGHALGEYLASQRFDGWEWLRRSNSYYYVISGMAALLIAFAVAAVVHMGGPWLGFLHGLLITVGVLATISAVTVGFGAVLLTRGGRIGEFAGPVSTAAAEPGIDEDPGPEVSDA